MTEQCPLTNKCKITSNIDCTNRDYPDCGFFQNELNAYCDQLQTQPKTPCKYQSVCHIRQCRNPTHKIPQVIPP